MNVIHLLEQKGISPRKVSGTNGGEFHSPCPSCGGTDRFHVWPAQHGGEGSFWCRQCGKAGDSIQFLRDFDGKTFQEACVAVGRDLPALQPKVKAPKSPTKNLSGSMWQPKNFDAPVSIWIEKAMAMISWCSENLMVDKSRLAWLETRGLDQKMVKKFLLGWNPGQGKTGALFRPRESWGLPTIKKADGAAKKLWIPRGLIIPCFVDGIPWRVRIRRPAKDVENGARYYVLPGSSMQPLLLNPKSRGFVVVESELDALLVDRAGGDLVGTFAAGNATAKPDIKAHEILKQSDCILLALDFDAAGSKAWRWWQNQYRSVKRWPVPEGKDPGESFQAGIDIRAWILAGLPPAWHIGKPKKAEPSAEGGPLVGLYNLLKKHPVSISSTDKRLGLIYSDKWSYSNWNVLGEISGLVFYDETVENFLANHPGDLINAKNFW